MTDALRPLGVATPGRPIDRPTLSDAPAIHLGPAVRAAADRAAVEVRRPYHLGTLLGVSACAYAISLAGVAWLQASSEAATAAVRAPAIEAAAQLAADNDRLEQALGDLRTRLGSTGDGYGAAAAALGDYEARLDALAIVVADLEARSSKLPTRIALPTSGRAALPSAPRAANVTKPPVVATTGASGG